jgi:hypothetical protein
MSNSSNNGPKSKETESKEKARVKKVLRLDDSGNI